jgi:hypothetical protein
VGLGDGADVGGQALVPVLDSLPAARDEVFQAADAGVALMQPLLDGLAPPAEAAFGLSGIAGAQLDGDLGLGGAAWEAGQSPGAGADQGIGAFGGFVHGERPGGRRGGDGAPERLGSSNRARITRSGVGFHEPIA